MQLLSNFKTGGWEILSLGHLEKFSFYLFPAIHIFSVWLHRPHYKYLFQLLVGDNVFLWSKFLFLTSTIHAWINRLPWSCCQMSIGIFTVSVSVPITTAHTTFRGDWLLVLTVAVMTTRHTLNISKLISKDRLEFRWGILTKAISIEVLEWLLSQPSCRCLSLADLSFFSCLTLTMKK